MQESALSFSETEEAEKRKEYKSMIKKFGKGFPLFDTARYKSSVF